MYSRKISAIADIATATTLLSLFAAFRNSKRGTKREIELGIREGGTTSNESS
jgi:hypothetical protein